MANIVRGVIITALIASAAFLVWAYTVNVAASVKGVG